MQEQLKAQIMCREAHKAMFDRVGNPKNKLLLRFMYCWLYLKIYPQWIYGYYARKIQYAPKKCRVIDIDLIMGEGQEGQGSAGCPLGEFQQLERQIKCKNGRNKLK